MNWCWVGRGGGGSWRGGLGGGGGLFSGCCRGEEESRREENLAKEPKNLCLLHDARLPQWHPRSEMNADQPINLGVWGPRLVAERVDSHNV